MWWNPTIAAATVRIVQRSDVVVIERAWHWRFALSERAVVHDRGLHQEELGRLRELFHEDFGGKCSLCNAVKLSGNMLLRCLKLVRAP